MAKLKFEVTVEVPSIRNEEKRDDIHEQIRSALEDETTSEFYDEDDKEYTVSYTAVLIEEEK